MYFKYSTCSIDEKKVVFCLNSVQLVSVGFHPENQLVSISTNLIQNSEKTSQQVSVMNGKSPFTRTSLRISFTDNTTQQTPRQSHSHWNISTPLTDSPQVLSCDKVITKVFNKNLLASLTSKDAVLKEVRDCIIRSEHNPVSGGCVCMDEKVAIQKALKDALIEDLH